ncbi:hypothetical protein Pcatena_04260 [Parolsenella catena]|uniref:HTH cro/C1-type domain-containing protein n=1 Tax=Parolsenella catena TaxID=2003188 RepID=A0A3G9K7R5_9ACTN|nr:helix-turn-helix transcriptional regulator [Parolsenella catena]BBH49839.1 hypothetical protein Pcatena_04260 [Parolsenella catena]
MDKNTMGRRLRSWMVDAGMTAEDLAARLKVSSGAVSSWTSGQRSVSLDRACQICDVFGKPLDELACRGE